MTRAGSHSTYGDKDPRVCCLCGKPVAMTSKVSEGTTFYHAGRVHLAYHRGCGGLRDALASTKGV